MKRNVSDIMICAVLAAGISGCAFASDASETGTLQTQTEAVTISNDPSDTQLTAEDPSGFGKAGELSEYDIAGSD